MKIRTLTDKRRVQNKDMLSVFSFFNALSILFIMAFLSSDLPLLSAPYAEGASFDEFSHAYDNRNYNRIFELVSSGSDLNRKDTNGRTFLTYAAAHSKDEEFAFVVAKLLIEHGADVNAEDLFARVPLLYAIEEDRRNLAELLINNKADLTFQGRAYSTPIVFVPFVRQNPALAYMVISKCSDLNIRDSLGNTPLSWAARFGYLDSVTFLLEKGALVNNASIHNKTPLMEAAEKGNAEIASLLIKAGADINTQTKKGWSALMWAAEKGYTEIVRMLIEAHADLFAKNNKGERALTIAQKNNHPETAKVIEDAEFRELMKKILIYGVPSLILIILLSFALRKINHRRKLGEKEEK